MEEADEDTSSKRCGHIGTTSNRNQATATPESDSTKVHFSFKWVAVNGHPLYDANFFAVI